MSNSNRLTSNTGTPEWYTPTSIIEPIRSVLGQIDLDPASCALANEIVKAKKYYDVSNDGLNKEWRGRVFLNPPYGRKIILPWIVKLIGSNEVDRWVCLTNNATETDWASILLKYSSHVFFPSFRIKFWNLGTKGNTPTQGQMICFSKNIEICDIQQAFQGKGFIFCNKTLASDRNWNLDLS